MEIDKLSTEQELLIPSFIKKWEEIAFSTKPTDKVKIDWAIKKIYRQLNLTEPIIYYCDRPTTTQDVLQNINSKEFGDYIHGEVEQLLFTQIEDYFTAQIIEDLWQQLDDDLIIRNFDCKPFCSGNFIDDDILDGFYGFDKIAIYEGRMFSRLIHYGLIFDYCQVVTDKFSNYLE